MKQFQGSFSNVSRKFPIPGCFMEVSRMFQRSFKEVLLKFRKVFQSSSEGNFNGVPRVFSACVNWSFKRVSRIFHGSFKEVSRIFLKCLIEV